MTHGSCHGFSRYLLTYYAANPGHYLKNLLMAAVQVALTGLNAAAWRKLMRLEMVLVSYVLLKTNAFGWGVVLCAG